MIQVPDLDEWFDDADGIPRPVWGAVHGWMRAFVQKPDLHGGWEQFCRHWLNRLCTAMGGAYAVAESPNFILLTDRNAEAQKRTLAWLEQVRAKVQRVLGDLDAPEAYGKHVVLRLAELDDYDAYVAHFLPDGEQADSGGMFITDGYLHIAYTEADTGDEELRTLVHELAHNLLAHLPLPLWLNEALAMTFEEDIAGSSRDWLSREIVQQHREYWDAETIQEFWSGASFTDVEGQELSYSLARVLLNLIHKDVCPAPEEFRRFVLRADWGDAGAIAAREHLETELHQLVASFLGPGEWAPRPKAWPAPASG